MDNPPIPSKKDVRIIFVDMALMGTEAIKDIPVVISRIPVINGAMKEEGTLIILKLGEIINVIKFKSLLDLNIEIITENNTTNPPIDIILEIDEDMDFDRNSPKFDKQITLLFLLQFFLISTPLCAFSLIPQNLNKSPTVKQDRIWVRSNRIPIWELPYIIIPTVPSINMGLELFVKLNNLSHSFLLKIFCFLRLQMIFVPIG